MRWSIAIVLLLASCTSMPDETSRTDAPRYLALGDSYTIGESVAAEERFPHQLARELGIGTPQIIAKTGWTTDELNAAVDTADPRGPFDLVTLLIGVNNQYRGREADEYRREFSTLLRRAIGFAGGDPSRVIVVSIPDWGVTPFGAGSGRDRAAIAAELDAYNAAAAAVCARHGVAFVDIAPVSRAHGAELVAADGLHPSAGLYAEWTSLALPAGEQLLSR